MKVCKGCGIIISGYMEVQYSDIMLCRVCYRYYQKEQFKFYYEKTKELKPKIAKICNVCREPFETAWKIKNTCSPKCRAEWKRRTNNERNRNL